MVWCCERRARGRAAGLYVGRNERFSKLVAAAKGQVYKGGKCRWTAFHPAPTHPATDTAPHFNFRFIILATGFLFHQHSLNIKPFLAQFIFWRGFFRPDEGGNFCLFVRLQNAICIYLRRMMNIMKRFFINRIIQCIKFKHINVIRSFN